MEIFTIDNHPYNEHLNNQTGVRAKVDIPENTVLGIYHGVRIQDHEFTEKFPSKNKEYYKYKKYHFDGGNEKMIKLIESITYDQYYSQQFGSNDKFEGYVRSKSSPLMKEFKPLARDKFDELKSNICKQLESDSSIDSVMLEDHKRPIIMYINDPRLNIFEETLTSEDKKYQNGGFYCFLLNGIKYTFALTDRDIKKNEEIMMYYGDCYHNLMNTMRNKNML